MDLTYGKARLRFGPVVAVAAAAIALLAPSSTAAPYASGPALKESQQALQDAVACRSTTTAARHSQPVLLVHGTTQTSAAAWEENYLPALERLGLTACTVDLPERGRGDIQRSAEYVVFAIRHMRERFGSKVDVVGFSQGPLEARWAVKFWPDVRQMVDDVVAIDAPYQGAAISNTLCASSCIPSMWQMRIGSNFLRALNTDDQTPGRVDYTSVYSLTDDVVFPQGGHAGSWQGDGAANIPIQRMCPGRVVDHVQATYDAVVFAVVKDALHRPGTATLSGIDKAVCAAITMPGVSPDSMATNMASGYVEGLPQLAGLSGQTTSGEPRLRPYAQ